MAAPLPQPRPGVMEAPLYVGGQHHTEGTAEPIVLSANENPFGPSPAAVAAYQQTAHELHRYPDGGSGALRDAIASRFGCDAAGIVCGAGSDELIQLLMRAYAGPGDEVVHSRHGFLMYAIAATGVGATPVVANSVVEGGWAGTGNLKADPLFCWSCISF